MGKNIMKSNRVAILMVIMLVFVQIFQNEAKFPCPIICGLECLLSPEPYGLCWIKCVVKCAIPTDSLDCVKSCGVNKSITIEIGIYSLNHVHISFKKHSYFF